MDKGVDYVAQVPNISSKLYIPAAVGVQTNVHRFGIDAQDKIAQHLLDNPHETAGDSSSSEAEADDGDLDREALAPAEDDEVIHPALGRLADPPNFARLRLNLAALSQQFNLYFVAYQDEVHVYLPQQAPDILPEPPSLILKPGRSQYARTVEGKRRIIPSRFGGYMRFLDKNSPHQANHLVVGDLGEEEALVLVYDDGDVVAYYTRHIANLIQSRQGRPRGDLSGKGKSRAGTWDIKPFFHDTVGVSAWGIAIHKQSRLIAVSSNYHEVHVFAFIKSPYPPGPPITKPAVVADRARAVMMLAGVSAGELEHQMRKRDRNWRIILPVGTRGSNIPTISFWNDERGNAGMVAAVDIQGNLFLLDIWKVGFRPIRAKWTPHNPLGGRHHDPPPLREDGWGVAVLPTVNFLRTESMMNTVGTSKRWCRLQRSAFGHPSADTWLYDISPSLLNVEDNDGHGRLGEYFDPFTARVEVEPSASTKHWSREEEADSKDEEQEEDNFRRDTYCEYPDSGNRNYDQLDRLGRGSTRYNYDRRVEVEFGVKFDMIIEPFKGVIHRAYNVKQLRKVLRDVDRRKAQSHLDLAEALQTQVFENDGQQVILRTYSTDIELMIPTANPIPVLCRRVLEQYSHFGFRNPPWDLGMANRACFVHPIPELSAVVVGSQNGRVAIIRTTHAAEGVKPSNPDPDVPSEPFAPADRGIHYGFRVECILPRTSEEKRRLRPYCCLLGVAVSPMPVEAPVFEKVNRDIGEDKPVTGNRTRSRRLADGTGKPRASAQRWRIILHYMNHTILMYTIQREKPDGLELQVIRDEGAEFATPVEDD